MLYNEDSAADQCTLYQLRNLINRRNVQRDPKNDVNAAEDFLELVTDAHIIHAASIELGSEDGETLPETVVQALSLLKTADERKAFLRKISLLIVDHYMLPLSPCLSSSMVDQTQQDHVFNYGKILLTLGMVHHYFKDSVREGDGDRVFSCWKILLPLFKQDGRRKYALEAFLLMAQDQALLSPQMAYQLKWARFVNNKGGAGRNMSCDLRLEHMNKFLKQSLHSVAPGFKQEGAHAVKRIANSISMCESIIDNFDENLDVHHPYGSHASRSVISDLNMILSRLTSKSVFKFEAGRKYRSPKCNYDSTIFTTLDMVNFNTWIERLKVKYNK